MRRNLGGLFRPSESSFKPLDGLRALSLLWVIAFHSAFLAGRSMTAGQFAAFASDPLVSFFLRGDLGVDIFFVISGFLISHILMGEYQRNGSISISRFYVRRMLRLFPVYFLVLGLYCLAPRSTNCQNAWANILYVNNFLPAEQQCMVWTWSLAVEEQFYMLYPIFLVGLYRLRRGRLAVLMGLLGLAFVIRGVVLFEGVYQRGISLSTNPFTEGAAFATGFDIYDKSYFRFGALLCGVIAAYLYHHGNALEGLRRFPRRAQLGQLVALTCLGLIAVVPAEWRAASAASAGALTFVAVDRYVFAAAVAYLLLISLCPSGPGGLLRRVLAARPWYPVAQLSYSAYLLHVIVISVGYATFLRPTVRSTDLSAVAVLGTFVLLTGLTLLVALPFHLFVERPMMNARPAARLRPDPGRAGLLSG